MGCVEVLVGSERLLVKDFVSCSLAAVRRENGTT